MQRRRGGRGPVVCGACADGMRRTARGIHGAGRPSPTPRAPPAPPRPAPQQAMATRQQGLWRKYARAEVLAADWDALLLRKLEESVKDDYQAQFQGQEPAAASGGDDERVPPDAERQPLGASEEARQAEEETEEAEPEEVGQHQEQPQQQQQQQDEQQPGDGKLQQQADDAAADTERH